MEKNIRFWIWVLMLSLLWGGIGTSYAQTGEVLRVAFPADARTFDPAIVTRDYTGYAVIGGNPARLIRRLETGDCVRHKSQYEYNGYIRAEQFESFRQKHLKVGPW